MKGAYRRALAAWGLPGGLARELRFLAGVLRPIHAPVRPAEPRDIPHQMVCTVDPGHALGTLTRAEYDLVLIDGWLECPFGCSGILRTVRPMPHRRRAVR